jgi:hypothetical protein
MRLAHDDVVSVLGPVDETVVADIVATGVTPAELAEARAWVNADEAMIGEGRPLPCGRVAELVELLQPDQDEP